MCLHLTKENKDSFIAEEDIVCYKRMFIQGGKLISPFRQHEYTLNKLEESSLSRTEDVKFFRDYYATVQEGLHSFVNLPSAHPCIIIAKCIIPKGAEVYKGLFGDHESYASNQLIITEIME